METNLSFTAKVKNEIASQSYDGVKLKALLAAFSKINGKLIIEEGVSKLILTTENAKVAKFIFLSFQTKYHIAPRFAYLRSMHFKKNIVYHVIVESKVEEILDDLEIFKFNSNTMSFVRSEDSLSGFLLGSFLATGSVNDPLSSNYHLEISTIEEEHAKYIASIMGRVHSIEFTPKIIKRRNHYVVYIKKSDQIANFLIFIDAPQACLSYEDVRINRDFYNNDNRLQICINANMVRTVESSNKQREDIELIDKKIGIKNIPNVKLKTLMELRLEHEESSMVELAEMMSKKLDKPVSKSSVNHMFRAIKTLAEKLKAGGN